MHFKTLNDSLTAYRYAAGTGPTIVFINSLGSEQSIWDDVIVNLGTSAGTLTYDLRGQGASAVSAGPYSFDLFADDLLALLDHLDLSDVILCGVSIGGAIAQATALKRPDIVRGLILSNTAAKLGTKDRWNDRIAAVKADGKAGIADQIMDVWFSATFRETHPDAWEGHKAMVLRDDAAGYINTCAALRDGDLTKQVSDITAPTICVTGDEDKSIPPADTATLAEQISGAELRVIAGSGHLPCLDAPSQVAGIIRELINKVSHSEDRAMAGMAVRRQVLGDAHVDRANANTSDFDAAFQALITEGAWGTVWASNAISRRERSMITLALLAALGNFDEIPMHIRATRRTGATETDINEAMQHVAIYAGVPRANHALKLAKQTLAEMKSQTHD